MFEINFRDSKPIYEQIKESVRRMIVNGVLTQDEKLPSVRELAASKALNPNTIQRAYRELEAEGYIYSIPGKGSFVAVREDIYARRREELYPMFDDTVRELIVLGVDKETMKQRLDDIYGRTDND